MYNSDNLCSDNYLKTYEGLWQYYRDKQALNAVGVIIDFPDNSNSALFKLKQKITGETGNDGTKSV